MAVAFAIILQYFDPKLNFYYLKWGVNIPNDSDYVTFLATIAGIGGVFIGLYYTSVSAVGSAIYSKVPSNVRDLLVQDQLGNAYMRFLSFLTLLCLVFIAFHISGLPRIFLVIFFVTIFSAMGLISFVKLGQRMFNLFDPTSLSQDIFRQLWDWLEAVKVGGFQWLDKSFQNHANQKVSAMLDTLEELADITAKEPHLKGRPFIALSKNILRFLIDYEQAKRSIPTESVWYEQRYQHRNWYRTDYTRVSVAHQTGTALQPEIINNREWIEEKVLPIIIMCVNSNLSDAKYTGVLSLFETLEQYVMRLTQESRLSQAFDFIEKLSSTVLENISKNTDEIGKLEVIEKLAIIERLAALPVSMAIEYRKVVEALDKSGIEKQLLAIRWDKETSIYKCGFKAYSLERLEWFTPRLNFEKQVEGKEVTPLWYKVEYLCQVEVERLIENTNNLLSKSVGFYLTLSESLKKHPWLGAASLSREWEYWHRLDSQINLWHVKYESISNDRRIDGLKWPDFGVKNLQSKSRDWRDKILKRMTFQNALEPLFSRPKGFPDYAGQFLHVTGEVVIEALFSNSIELIEDIFEPYLKGCLMNFYSLLPSKIDTTDWRTKTDIKIASATLLDVMEISGCVRLFADYHHNEKLWDVVVLAWNDYGKKNESTPPLMTLLKGSLAISEDTFGNLHRGMHRSQWQIKIQEKIWSTSPKLKPQRGYGVTIIHDSALVRIFSQDYNSYDGIDIFLEFYIRSRELEGDFNFSRRRRGGLREEIEREKKPSPSSDLPDGQGNGQ